MTLNVSRWAGICAWALGLCTAWLVYTELNVQHVLFERPAEPLRTAVKVASRGTPSPSAAQPAETLPLAAKLPKRSPPMPALPAPAASTPSQPIAPIVVVSAPPLDLTQPTVLVAKQPVLSATPPLDAVVEQPPPKPPEDTVLSLYNDESGKNVVVIAMLVNSEGDVIDSKPVISSRYPLKDLALLAASKQQKLLSLQPPLTPGEVRWVEVRLIYPDPFEITKETLIP